MPKINLRYMRTPVSVPSDGQLIALLLNIATSVVLLTGRVVWVYTQSA